MPCKDNPERGFCLIDPPIGPYSPKQEIEAWLAELREQHSKECESARSCIREAEDWLNAHDV